MSEQGPTSSSAHADFDRATSWAAVAAATGCGIAVSMNIGKLAIALPLLRSEFGLSLVAAGWLVATFNLIAMIAGILMGISSDRFGALRFCLAGMVLSLSGSLLAVGASGSASMMTSRIVEGVGFIAVAASAPALVSAATHPDARRLSLAVWSCFMPTGTFLCMITAPTALGWGGWRTLWWLVIAIGVGVTLALWTHRRHYGRAASGTNHAFGDVRDALRSALPWWLALAMAGYAIQFFALVNWMPTYLRDVRAFDATTSAWLSAIVIGANIPGNLIGGVLLHRGFDRGVLVATVSVLMLACNFGIYTDSLDDRLRFLMCVVLNLVGGALPAAVNSSSAALARRPQQVSTLQGLYMQSANLGQFVGALAVSGVVAAAADDWSAALWVVAPVAAISAVAGMQYRRSTS